MVVAKMAVHQRQKDALDSYTGYYSYVARVDTSGLSANTKGILPLEIESPLHTRGGHSPGAEGDSFWFREATQSAEIQAIEGAVHAEQTPGISFLTNLKKGDYSVCKPD